MSPDEEKMKPPRIDVVDLATGKVIARVQLREAGARYAERVMRGMMHNLRDGLVLNEVLK